MLVPGGKSAWLLNSIIKIQINTLDIYHRVNTLFGDAQLKDIPRGAARLFGKQQINRDRLACLAYLTCTLRIH